jgi:DNA-binding transcriptional LysR family regulator
MDLDDLTIFRAVVQEGGITRAAARLHRVQSNVTTRIRQLEDSLGVPLFSREGKKLILAPAGQVLLDYAERLLDLAGEARAAVGDGVPRGKLRLGSMESTAAARLPPLLAAFHQRYGEVQLELRTGPTATLAAEVLAGRLDCALVCASLVDERLSSVPVFAEEMLLITPANHPPVRSARDLQLRTLLTFGPGCAYRQRLENWLAAAAMVPERIVDLSSYHAMIGCVAAGMGVAIVPASLLAKLPADGAVRAHPLQAPFAKATTVLIHRQGQRSPAVGALLALIEAAAVEPPTPVLAVA